MRDNTKLLNKIGKFRLHMFTFRSLLSFPAKANSNVVFPELGGPKSSVILQNIDKEYENLLPKPIYNNYIFLFPKVNLINYLLGFIIPLTSLRIGSFLFLLGRM